MDRSGTRRDASAEDAPSAVMVNLDGPAMRGLAQVLASQGDRVSGSVAEESPTSHRLRQRGIRVHAGHPPRTLSRSARVLVHDADLPRTHPARLGALLRGVERVTGPEMVGRCLSQGTGLAVAGDRCAGLAAAMIGWTLEQSGLDPTVLLDTFTPQLGGWGRLGQGPNIIAEVAEESVAADVLVLLDAGACPNQRAQSFRRRVEIASPGDYILGFAPCDDPGGCADQEGFGVVVERFSLSEGRDWWGADVREDRGGSRFRAFHQGRFVAEIRLQIPGRSAVLSALAAVASCVRLEVSARGIKEALEDFAGVSRGFESRGSYRGVTLLDDEARGPGAVGEVLGAARRIHGRRRLCVVYRPEGDEALATRPTTGEFISADRIWIIDELGKPGGPEAKSLAGDLVGAELRVDRVATVNEAIRELDRYLEPGDVLVTLGAGDVGTIADAFLRRLSRHRHD